jgi:hypothetical protein
MHAMRQALTGNGAGEKVVHARVPMGTSSSKESLGLWAELLDSAVESGAPIWLVSRNGCDWLDIVVGEPAPRHLVCLQASVKGSPLATETPYEIEPDIPNRWSKIETRFLKGSGRGSGRLGLMLIAAGLVVVVLLAVVLLRSGHAPSKAENTGQPATSAVPHSAEIQIPKAGQPAVTTSVPAVVEPGSATSSVNREATQTPPQSKPNLDALSTPAFAKAIKAARDAEDAGNFTNALAAYWIARNLNKDDVNVLENITRLTTKVQEQTQKADQEARRRQEIDNAFARQMDAARAAASAGKYENALASYEAALKIQEDPAARKGITDVQAKIKDAAVEEKQTAARFQEAMDTAKKAEDNQDFAGALVGYQNAQAIRTNDAQVAERIKAITAKLEQMRAQAARDQAESDRVKVLVAAGKESEQAGNFTNALASYQEARKIRTNAELAGLIQDVTPKAEAQAKSDASNNKESRLQEMDAELESLLVSFGVIKADQARTDIGKKAPVISGVLGMDDINRYINQATKLESEYKAGGWLNQDQRAEKIKKLVAYIKSHG